MHQCSSGLRSHRCYCIEEHANSINMAAEDFGDTVCKWHIQSGGLQHTIGSFISVHAWLRHTVEMPSYIILSLVQPLSEKKSKSMWFLKSRILIRMRLGIPLLSFMPRKCQHRASNMGWIWFISPDLKISPSLKMCVSLHLCLSAIMLSSLWEWVISSECGGWAFQTMSVV